MLRWLAALLFYEFDGGNDIGVCRGQAHATPNLGTMTGKEAEAFYLGLNAVIWGYPAVKFEELMQGRTQPDIVKLGNPQSAVNQTRAARFGFFQ